MYPLHEAGLQVRIPRIQALRRRNRDLRRGKLGIVRLLQTALALARQFPVRKCADRLNRMAWRLASMMLRANIQIVTSNCPISERRMRS